MAHTDIGTLVVWGFFAGFVVWGSLFRLVQPAANWLMPVPQGKGIITGLPPIVWTFLMVAGFLVIDASPRC